VRALTALVAAITVGALSYILAAGAGPASQTMASDSLRTSGASTSVLTGTPTTVTAELAQRLFVSAPVVVVAASSARSSLLAAAASEARSKSAPLLLVSQAPRSSRIDVSRPVQAEVKALRPEAVLAVGIAPRSLAALLPGTTVVSAMSALPAVTAPAGLRSVAILIAAGDKSAATTAVAASAHSAGAQVVSVHGEDPRADPAAITVLARTKPQRVVAVGAGFGTASSLALADADAETGVQLPGGGQILFPMHRLICLYGSPSTPALGALGQQDLPASIARIQAIAAKYRPLSRVPVVPAFEILATIAQGSAGHKGLYSFENTVAALRPWVLQATRDGLYVILDLQPGRADLLTQAKRYQSLLKLPDVGLALDPEWKLQPTQLPLHQIGSVSVGEINSVITWLARLTARYRLPQKLLVLHQFRLSMIVGESRIDTQHKDLAIVIHMDGQGAPSSKQQTWNAVISSAPRGVFFGWKNFFVKDHPMLTARQTMRHRPRPVMISYQ